MRGFVTGTARMAAGFAVGAAAISALPQNADAGAFAIREQSAYSQGASFAGNATCGESVQGMFWNSAIVTCHGGRNFEASASLIIPDAEITTLAGTAVPTLGDPGSYGQFGFVPSSSSSWQLNEQWYVGITTNGPYGLGVKPDFPSSGMSYSREGKIFSLNFNPTIGYKPTDWLSLGFGVQIQYFDLLEFSRSAVPGGGGIINLEGDDWGYGFTFGALITPMEGTEIGIGYRSSVKHDIEGTINAPGLFTAITAEADMPELVTVSLRQRLNDRWTALGTFEWTNWSNLPDAKIIAPAAGGQIATLPFNYEDGYYFALGAEYEYNDDLTLRAGAAWEISPIGDESRSVSLPDDDRLWLSFGGSYDYDERLTFNFGYSFITTFNTQIALQPGNPWFSAAQGTFFGDVDNTVHILSFGARYKFGDHEPELTKF
ncbi:MAG: outer membrane protein transport protein [Pseudomonadota bacterium]